MIFHNKYFVKSIVTHLFWILFLFSFSALKGQKSISPVHKDTIRLKEGSTLILNKKKIKIHSDTTFILLSNVKYEIILSREDRFYNNIENRAKNNFWTRELHNIIITDNQSINKTDTIKIQPSSQPFEAYRKKNIRNIIIKQLPVFGPTISDTLSKPTTFFQKTANKLHFQTKKFLIVRNLLFKENDPVNPDVLADNERILRSLPYIEDSKIEIIPLGPKTDSVDVMVIVKDNWTLAFDLKIDKLNTGRINFLNKNIFGLGQEMQNSVLWNKNRRPGTGYEGMYMIHNIGGSFIKGNIIYNKSFGEQILGLNLNRDFFTPNVKYAGGFAFKNVKADIRHFDIFPEVFFPIEFNEYQFWSGRSFLLTKENTKQTRQNITFAGKVIIDRFYDRPVVSKTSYYQLFNKNLFLFSVIYTHQNYFKSNRIYNFGRTEDIPVGIEFAITSGYEISEFYKRKYISGKIASGKFLGRYGYLSAGTSIGSFFNGSQSEQGVLSANCNYFTNLYVFNRYGFRQFITLNLTKGINRFYPEYIYMNDTRGISGLRNDSIFGNHRLNMKCETVCFTPWKFLDFKFVLFAYSDLTWLGKENQKIFYGSPYAGFGFGVRLRNERLVFNTIQLRFSFYPNIPQGSITSFMKLSGEPVLNPVDFSPKAPQLIDFK
jgi:hypothetical protein